ncbi:hypothetical protein LPJ63_001626 [Coemansia sp. RSA 2711]|nr:hypothetical protein LPJ63_001626 [Coemansia sp. RSA 2711]KAJ1845357.1 hypothetical protein LPJ70_002536 [Coemansia sp. RSA 2708]KAJ2304254.1 hypothetical protein IWW54_005466 [Coemansia sp. RSA 2705]KAJ2311081.1 hypothetical protein IWW52_005229 [Coemansia sp. RSA 2704]KAJ2317464.1 hypothetical protein IWW51_005357 [Coemansia sp. RSA 2702]KAJ2361036.1 hypothetical protein H4S01_005448 [Coemansia sp. RSA 2610]KAJ2375195.1 hypothetical protein H4S02_008305 [Coemansia sp. RSA 2611]KAJ271803
MDPERVSTGHTAFIAQARQRSTQTAAAAGEASAGCRNEPEPPRDAAGLAAATAASRITNLAKLVLFAWLGWWVVRYFEVDRSLRGEPETPHVSMAWLYAALCSLLPFTCVYLYASVWRRRVLGEPLDLQNWQASSSSLVHAATIGLLLAWLFAAIALFPGFGLKSVVIVAVCTICAVAMMDALEGIF